MGGEGRWNGVGGTGLGVNKVVNFFAIKSLILDYPEFHDKIGLFVFIHSLLNFTIK